MQLFLQCAKKLRSNRNFVNRGQKVVAAKLRIVDAFLRSVPRPVILGDLSFCPHSCFSSPASSTPPKKTRVVDYFSEFCTQHLALIQLLDTTRLIRLHQQDPQGPTFRFRTGLWTFVCSSEAQHEMHGGRFGAVFGTNLCWRVQLVVWSVLNMGRKSKVSNKAQSKPHKKEKRSHKDTKKTSKKASRAASSMESDSGSNRNLGTMPPLCLASRPPAAKLPVLKCERRHQLPSAKMWFHHASVHSSDGTVIGAKCDDCGHVYWNDSNFKKAVIEAVQNKNSGGGNFPQQSVGKAFMQFLELRQPARVLNAEELRKALGTNILPKCMKSVPKDQGSAYSTAWRGYLHHQGPRTGALGFPGSQLVSQGRGARHRVRLGAQS